MMCEEENVDMGIGIIVCIIRSSICIGREEASIPVVAGVDVR
jgi:uncharacterized protein (UPF0254 family)